MAKKSNKTKAKVVVRAPKVEKVLSVEQQIQETMEEVVDIQEVTDEHTPKAENDLNVEQQIQEIAEAVEDIQEALDEITEEANAAMSMANEHIANMMTTNFDEEAGDDTPNEVVVQEIEKNLVSLDELAKKVEDAIEKIEVVVEKKEHKLTKKKNIRDIVDTWNGVSLGW